MIPRLLLAAAIFLVVQPLSAHEFSVGDITITHPFFRATPPAAQTGGGYMVLTNKGAGPEKLIGIESSAAKSVEFHQTVVKDGMATMTAVPDGFEIPAGGTVVIGDDGLHIMLVGLSLPIREGETIDATLIFERAGRYDMYFEVEPLGKVIDQHGPDHGQ